MPLLGRRLEEIHGAEAALATAWPQGRTPSRGEELCLGRALCEGLGLCKAWALWKFGPLVAAAPVEK